MKNLIPFVLYLIFSLSSLAQNVSYKIQTPYACASVSSATDRVGLVVEQLGSSQVKFYLVKLSSGCSSSPNATFSKGNPFTVYESNGTQIGTANTVQGKGYSEAVNHTLPTSFTSGTKQYYAKIPAANATVGNVSITATMTPYLTLGFNSTVVSSTTGTNSVSISSNTSWTVTSSNTAWLLPRVSSGANNQTVSFDYQANTSLSSRSAKLIFKTTTLTQEITVVQNGATPTLSLSTNTASVNATQGQSNVNVYSNTSWTASSNAAWLIPRTASGTGNQNVVFEYQVNTSSSARSGNIVFKSGSLIKTLTVTQAVSEEESMRTNINFSNVDVSRKNGGIVIYTRNKGNTDAEIIYIVDMSKGAKIEFNVGKQNGTSRTYLRQTTEEVFSEKKNLNLVAVVNGQFFGETSDYSTLVLPVKSKGLSYGSSTISYRLGRYYQKLGIRDDKKAAYMSDLNPSSSTGYAFTSSDGIIGKFITVGESDNPKNNMNTKDHYTIIGGIDTDQDTLNGYEKMAVYIGNNTKHNACVILKALGVEYQANSDGSIIGNTSILQLDGGGSAQAYGIDGWHKKSSDYSKYVGPLRGSCYNLYKCSDNGNGGLQDCFCDTRKVPQTISIIANLPIIASNRISATDSTTSTELLDENGDGLTIYPNPNKDGLITVTYALPKDIQSNEASVSINNLLGQTLHQQALSEVTGTLQFNLSNHPTGNYIVTLQVGSHRISKKVILQQ